MGKIILISILFFSFGRVYSQKADSVSIFSTRTYTFSYFGNNLIYPGLKAATNITLKEKTVIKSKTKKSGKIVDRSTKRQLLSGFDIGFFWQPKSHIGAFSFFEFTYRIIKQRTGAYTKFGIGPGIYRSFYPKTYEVDNSGNVNSVPFGGRAYFAPVFIFGTGKFKKDKFFQSRTFTTNLMFLFDYNGGIVPLLNLEFGFCFDFKK